MKNQLDLFEKFKLWCNYVKIVSKEKGLMSFSYDKWYSSQKYLMQEIFKEICSNSQVREFFILKARQLGITNILSALDEYWVNAIKGIKLGFLCHSYEARPKLREIFRTIYIGLPRNMKMPLLIDNRDMMKFANGSEIQFMHISSRESSKQNVSRSQAFTCLHATEVAFYDASDPSYEVLKSLTVAMSKSHPARYVILETTANGFNYFYDMWNSAKRNPTQKTIFIGWYMRDDYRISKKSPLYANYSYPLTREEKEKIKIVKELYNIDIDMEQIAWYRKEVETTFHGDINYASQELPFYEDEAFRITGYKYFPAVELTKAYKNASKTKFIPLNIYADMNGIYIDDATKNNHNLKIFEFPKENEVYYIGADPSWGANPDSDKAVISVWKGYKDKIIQVAEYGASGVGVIEFAKLCLFFACFYKKANLNLEIQGPGQAVLKEINAMRQRNYDLGNIIWNSDNSEINLNQIKENINYVREYLYYRADTLGRHFVKHWQTTRNTKEAMMAQFKSLFSLGQIEIKSIDLIEEMKYFVKDGTYLGAEAGRFDDRVIAAAIAVEYWRRYGSRYLVEYEKRDTMQEYNEENLSLLKVIGIYDRIRPFIEGQKW